MNDLPPGEYSEILVGPVWVGEASLDYLGSTSTKFGDAATTLDHYADQLHLAWSGPLADQRGETASDARSAFERGEQQTRDTAEKYRIKQAAFDAAHSSAAELQNALTTIATDGNARIKDIQDSKAPAPVRIAAIVEVVMDCQTRANASAATCGGSMFEAIQTILDKEGTGTSARQFANDNGIDTTRLFRSPDRETIQEQVTGLVNRAGPPRAPAPDIEPQSLGTDIENRPSAPTNQTSSTPEHLPGLIEGPTPPPPARASDMPRNFTGGMDSGSTHTQAAPPPAPPAAPPVTGPAPAPMAPTPQTGVPQGVDTGAPPTTAATSTPPVSTTPPIAAPLQPAAPVASEMAGSTAPTAPTVSAAPATTHAPVFDTPAPPPAPTNPHPHILTPAAPLDSPPAPADTAPAYLAGPPMPPPTPAPTPSAPAAPPTPTGTLPAYGADIRPTATAATAPAGPSSSTPASAPITAAASHLGHPAVVRQSSHPATPVAEAAGLSERSVAAATVGAVAGTAATAATVRNRLQLLVDAVARQEPWLRWAAGERPDGTTVLVTDLACGWIPPHVDVPSGVRLLDPEPRRGNLRALLGETTMIASYEPAQYLPPAEAAEPVPTSTRARQGPTVDELGWHLGQATKWRDGLPRLAHTLATAGSRHTGVDSTEIALLRTHLAAIQDQVLDSYPDGINHAAVENWQLLASIDALVANDETGAVYHFAWFQALSAARI